MGSWRDNASEQAQEDLDGLLDTALGFAQQQLEAQGEFFPYAVVVDTSGQIEAIAARPNPVDEQPDSTDVIESCVAAITSQRDYTRACGIVADVRLHDIRSNAIQVELEHTDGQALAVQLPYTIKRRGKAVEYGQLRALSGQRRIWP